MDIDPGQVLGDARTALQEKQYSTALEKYQWFFDNATKIKRSYYGVRLSYCLDEWAELGKEYPPAMKALVDLKEKALSGFKDTLSRQSFHKYSSIARYLEDQDEVFSHFLPLHKSNKELAEQLFTFVYEYCATNGMWSICREYLGNGQQQYEKSLEMFDHMLEFSKKRASNGGESIYREAADSIKRESLWILNMLHHEHSLAEYDSVISKIESDLRERGFEGIYREICDNAPNKIPEQ